MSELAVYSSEYDPQRLYVDGDDGPDVDHNLVTDVVRAGDRPLDLLVDVRERVVVWSFKAQRRTKSARTGYFVAVYEGEADGDLFGGFEAALRDLHESDEWSIPHVGEARWDAGFDLWRIPGEVPGLDADQFDRLTDRLDDRRTEDAVEFGMGTHRSALQVVRAVADRDVDCTVAVGESDDTAPGTVDLRLVPGAPSDFEPRSLVATSITGSDHTAATAGQAGDGEATGPSRNGAPQTDRGSAVGFASRISGAVLVVFLGFALYSFVSPSPVQPITGLSTVGGLVGSAAALTTGRIWLEDESNPSASAAERVQAALLEDVDWTVIAVTYGAVVGFAFPRIMWEVGLALGADGFLLGSITAVTGALISVGLYTAGLLGFALGLVALRGDGRSDSLLAATVAGHAAYGFCLFLATGLAGSLWFQIIPSAT